MIKSKYNCKEWDDKIIAACDGARSMAYAHASLGMNKNTFITHAKRLGVYVTNQPGRGLTKVGVSIPLGDIIYSNKNPQYGSTHLRHRLIKEGIKPHQCESCKRKIWQKQPIPLELHHIDGNSTNHLLGNLKLLCSNCHSLTNNYGSKNKKG